MTTHQHIELLETIHRRITATYDGMVPDGGDLWQASPLAVSIREAVRSLRASLPTTIGELEAEGRL
jgi:hypothetical protein